jgi:hypothetical protein
MQIKSLDHALPYFFMQRIHGNDPGNLPELERSKGVLENILRWEDDGGKIIEINHSMLDQKKEKTNE